MICFEMRSYSRRSCDLFSAVGHYPRLNTPPIEGHQLVFASPHAMSLVHARHLQPQYGAQELDAFNAQANSDANDYVSLFEGCGFMRVPNSNDVQYGLLFSKELKGRLKTLFNAIHTHQVSDCVPCTAQQLLQGLMIG